MSSASRPIRKKSKPSDEYSENRIALVIGNSAYSESPLVNPINDATDMAAALKTLDFEVYLHLDASQKVMIEAFDTFGRKLHRGGVGLFFYAGHGLQVKGQNYLVPTDAQISKELDVEFEAVNVGRILREMEHAQNRVNIVILDACRNNPYERKFRSGSSGLASIDASRGTLIAYSTAPGTVADDGTGKNSPYTEELFRQILIEDIEVERVFKLVRSAVIKKSEGRQVPWESSSLVGDFYFRPSVAANAAKPESIKEPVEILPKSVKIIPNPKSDIIKSEQEIKTSPKTLVTLRREPIEYLFEDEVKKMMLERGFYHSIWNKNGKGILHEYTAKKINDDKVVIDDATGLMWQQFGSSDSMRFEQAIHFYVDHLNQGKFAGYEDWRLPTLEEAMSLMEPERKGNPFTHNLYIHPVFHKGQWCIWSSDQQQHDRVAWLVDFYDGSSKILDIANSYFARVVRSLYSSANNSSQNIQPEQHNHFSNTTHKSKTPQEINKQHINLRNTPKSELSEYTVIKMLQEKEFYDRDWNKSGKGIQHEYSVKAINKDIVVIDEVTRLMWQQSGSNDYMTYHSAIAYIEYLNEKLFAGQSGWRLPTLEEAMSLMEDRKKNNDLFIDPVFDARHEWIWTSDQQRAPHVWLVCFGSGYCDSLDRFDDIRSIYVRAVRSLQSSE